MAPGTSKCLSLSNSIAAYKKWKKAYQAFQDDDTYCTETASVVQAMRKSLGLLKSMDKISGIKFSSRLQDWCRLEKKQIYLVNVSHFGFAYSIRLFQSVNV